VLNPTLLRVTREALGLTQVDVARLTGFDQAEISRWERGLRQPSERCLPALGAALEVGPEFLAQQVAVAEPVHRSARIESKRLQREVRGRLELSRLAMERIFADIEIDVPFRFPTISEPGPPDPELSAESVRRVWRIPDGPLSGLTGYLEAAGATVLRVDFGIDSIIAAYCQLAANGRWFYLNTQAHDPARNRFSLAHELGHAVLHWDRFDAPAGADAEREAHQFASALLMPRHDIASELAAASPTLGEFVRVAERWGVSAQALIMRAEALELISPHKKRRVFQQLNARGLSRAALTTVEDESPRIPIEALQMQRTENSYSDQELAEVIGMPLLRLQRLLPDYFRPSGRPQLRLIGATRAKTA
jgi:Zn-dependent peptidase ImmA (M78 family)/DNA-binding XRE family transcriptional regulator